MSLTKAVIGVVYDIYNMPHNAILFDDVRVGDALNNTTGYIEEDGEFPYFAFVTQWEKGSITEWAINHVKRQRRDKDRPFNYNNMMWQILASSFEHLAYVRLDVALLLLLGTTKGWHWNVDQDGTVIGPHGIHWTKDIAELFIEQVQCRLFNGGRDHVVLPDGFWAATHNPHGRLVTYRHGWFYTNEMKCAFGIGYQSQYLAATKDATDVQIFEENYAHPPTKYHAEFILRFVHAHQRH